MLPYVTFVTRVYFPSFAEKSDLKAFLGNKGNTPEKHPHYFVFRELLS